MIYAGPGQSFEATAQGFASGLAGTIGVRILDNVGGTTTPRVTAGIIESPASSGAYAVTLTAPITAGQYSIFWDTGVVSPTTTASEDLTVTSSLPVVVLGGPPPGGIDLCTVDDVRVALEVEPSDTKRDGLFATLITAASRAIMADCDREFAPATTSATRRFRWQGMRFLSLAPYDLRNVTAFTLHPESAVPMVLAAGTHYLLGPTVTPYGVYQSVEFSLMVMPSRYSQTFRDYGFTFVDITGGWGFATLPEDVVQACIVTCMSWLRRDTSAYAMRDPEDVRMLAGDPMQTFTIPPAAKRLLHPFRRSVAL